MPALLPGFASADVAADGIAIHLVRGWAGPPVPVLHSYPQTHAMWHQVAPVLAERFTVVCPTCADTRQPEARVAATPL